VAAEVGLPPLPPLLLRRVRNKVHSHPSNTPLARPQEGNDRRAAAALLVVDRLVGMRQSDLEDPHHHDLELGARMVLRGAKQLVACQEDPGLRLVLLLREEFLLLRLLGGAFSKLRQDRYQEEIQCCGEVLLQVPSRAGPMVPAPEEGAVFEFVLTL
jgi:hypothetical protein